MTALYLDQSKVRRYDGIILKQNRTILAFKNRTAGGQQQDRLKLKRSEDFFFLMPKFYKDYFIFIFLC